jgi:hypothetical protein
MALALRTEGEGSGLVVALVEAGAGDPEESSATTGNALSGEQQMTASTSLAGCNWRRDNFGSVGSFGIMSCHPLTQAAALTPALM